ncbi:hypothetical protein ACFL2R_00440 [Patescibacteria group bacterium]
MVGRLVEASREDVTNHLVKNTFEWGVRTGFFIRPNMNSGLEDQIMTALYNDLIYAVNTDLVTIEDEDRFDLIIRKHFDRQLDFSSVVEKIKGEEISFDRNIVIVENEVHNMPASRESCIWVVKFDDDHEESIGLTSDGSLTDDWSVYTEDVRPATQEEVQFFVTDDFLRKINKKMDIVLGSADVR